MLVLGTIMPSVSAVIEWIRNPGALIAWGGYPALAAVVFLETGALAFFLPGDSLLVVAGFFAAKGDLSLVVLNGLLIPMAILGDALSYLLGSKLGSRLLDPRHARWFRPQYLEAAETFYKRHGGKAIVMARFVPVVRTFVPVVAGMAQMGYRSFALFNISGATLWISSMTLIGYTLGVRFPILLEHVEKVIVAVVVLSFVPAAIEVVRARRGKA